jgi:hypothetical protein
VTLLEERRVVDEAGVGDEEAAADELRGRAATTSDWKISPRPRPSVRQGVAVAPRMEACGYASRMRP